MTKEKKRDLADPYFELFESIPLEVHNYNGQKKAVVFVSGSSGSRREWIPIINKLRHIRTEFVYIAFSFSGREAEQDKNLELQSQELFKIADYTNENLGVESLYIVATSQGAVSACEVVAHVRLKDKISQVIFLDPADYPTAQSMSPESQTTTWDGHMIFDAKEPLFSDFLQKTSQHTRINVVHFTLKNYGNGSYFAPDYSARGVSHIDGYPRLNTTMARGFFDKVPGSNKEYLEIDNLPHAFNRDGDVEANQSLVSRVLADLLI